MPGSASALPGQPVQHKATVLRLDLTHSAGQTAGGQRPDPDRRIGLGAPGRSRRVPDRPDRVWRWARMASLYVSDAIGNRVVAIPDAATRTNSAGTGTEITKDGLLNRPLAMAYGAERQSARGERAEWPGGGCKSAGNRQTVWARIGSMPMRRKLRPAAAICSASSCSRTARVSTMSRTT